MFSYTTHLNKTISDFTLPPIGTIPSHLTQTNMHYPPLPTISPIRTLTESSAPTRTLYCAKGNYEFGISRVIKSLEPYQKKLGTDTWYHAKRCFLSLIENMTKHMVMLRDNVLVECIQFLEHCEGLRISNLCC